MVNIDCRIFWKKLKFNVIITMATQYPKAIWYDAPKSLFAYIVSSKSLIQKFD